MNSSRMRLSQLDTGLRIARGRRWRDSGVFCREWRAGLVGSGRRCERIRRLTQWMMQETQFKQEKAKGNASRVGRRERGESKQKKIKEDRESRKKEGI